MSKSFQFSLLIKGIILASALALVLSLGFGLLLSLTSLPESELSLNIILIVSVFIAGLITANSSGTKGLYYGLAVGIGFIVFLFVISSIFISASPSWLKMGEKIILALASGGVGGIIGVVARR
ncbi:MAG: TIGR04086 family membrane protein [Desulfitobacterium hafniense]|nr:TIGR04086 family membrane protein [Desulfitobacterium hafniense]